ncbi:MAG: 2,3-bisphosphoglycerate-dependent phosphoglycerate mutase [Chlamydiia bacterium]|nr:2,3-bisphosphoglycerate-dependent phosphoglycerate mutase [Chlamydiia bacterium]
MSGKAAKLVLVRHGQSVWNKRNLFTGWVDIPLSQKGIDEALKAGDRINNIPFDVIYLSTLVRAEMTAMLAMSRHNQDRVPCIIHRKDKEFMEMAKIHDPASLKMTIPTYCHADLNERMYGKLQGLNKDETKKKFGEEQFLKWRRSFASPPPEGESLEMTANRTLPFFKEGIMPHLEKGENILISAHGNSLRSIVMHLDQLSPDEVVKLEIPTGEPICYHFENGSWKKQCVDECNKEFA